MAQHDDYVAPSIELNSLSQYRVNDSPVLLSSAINSVFRDHTRKRDSPRSSSTKSGIFSALSRSNHADISESLNLDLADPQQQSPDDDEYSELPEPTFPRRWKTLLEFGRFDSDITEFEFCQGFYGSSFFLQKFSCFLVALINTVFPILDDFIPYPLGKFPTDYHFAFRLFLRFFPILCFWITLNLIYLLQPILSRPLETEDRNERNKIAKSRRRLFLLIDFFVQISVIVFLSGMAGMSYITTTSKSVSVRNAGSTLACVALCFPLIGRVSLFYVFGAALFPLATHYGLFHGFVGAWEELIVWLIVWLVSFTLFYVGLTWRSIAMEVASRRLFMLRKKREWLSVRLSRQQNEQRKAMANFLPAAFIDRMMEMETEERESGVRRRKKSKKENEKNVLKKKVRGYYQTGTFVVCRVGLVGLRGISGFEDDARFVDTITKIFAKFDSLMLSIPAEKLKSFGSNYIIFEPSIADDGAAQRILVTALRFESIVRKIAGKQVASCLRIALAEAPGLIGTLGQGTETRLTFEVWGDVSLQINELFNSCSPHSLHISKSVHYDDEVAELVGANLFEEDAGSFSLDLSKCGKWSDFSAPERSALMEEEELEIRVLVEAEGKEMSPEEISNKTTLEELAHNSNEIEPFEINKWLVRFRSSEDRNVFNLTRMSNVPTMLMESLVTVSLGATPLILSASLLSNSLLVSIVHWVTAIILLAALLASIVFRYCYRLDRLDEVVDPRKWRSIAYVVSSIVFGLAHYAVPLAYFVSWFFAEYEGGHADGFQQLYIVFAMLVIFSLTLRPFWERILICFVSVVTFVILGSIYVLKIAPLIIFMILFFVFMWTSQVLVAYQTTIANLLNFKFQRETESKILSIVSHTSDIVDLIYSFLPEEEAEEVTRRLFSLKKSGKRGDFFRILASGPQAQSATIERSLIYVRIDELEECLRLQRVGSAAISLHRVEEGLLFFQRLHEMFEKIARSYGLFVVRVVGTSLLIMGREKQTPSEIIEFCFGILGLFREMHVSKQSDTLHASIRIGAHCGSVQQGLVGEIKTCYDLFGKNVKRVLDVASSSPVNSFSCSGIFLTNALASAGTFEEFQSIARIASRTDHEFVLIPPTDEDQLEDEVILDPEDFAMNYEEPVSLREVNQVSVSFEDDEEERRESDLSEEMVEIVESTPDEEEDEEESDESEDWSEEIVEVIIEDNDDGEEEEMFILELPQPSVFSTGQRVVVPQVGAGVVTNEREDEVRVDVLLPLLIEDSRTEEWFPKSNVFSMT